ncbi:MAG: hypothetical protein QOF21_938 [Actinomycetota bacterium]|jgi:hypothetical protein
MDSPVTLTLDPPDAIDRWRPLVQWILALPHLFVVAALTNVSGALGLVAFFSVLFTKQVPDGIYNAQAMIWRYGWRTMSYAGFLHDSYPPYDFTMTLEDPGGSPAAFSLDAPPDELSRWMPLVKWLAIIPHAIALLFVTIGLFFVYIAAFFAVLFTGVMPEGMRRFIIGTHRWTMRVNAYAYLLTDEYPPFSLD